MRGGAVSTAHGVFNNMNHFMELFIHLVMELFKYSSWHHRWPPEGLSEEPSVKASEEPSLKPSWRAAATRTDSARVLVRKASGR